MVIVSLLKSEMSSKLSDMYHNEPIPNHLIIGNGELIAATFKDRSGREPVISGSYLDGKLNWPQLTTQRDSMNLNGRYFIFLRSYQSLIAASAINH